LHTLKAFLEKVDREKREKRSYSILVNDPQYRQLETLIYTSSTKHPKIDLLRKDVKDQLQRKPSSRMLVFTQYRDTASHIVEELNEIPSVEALRFVGQASKINDEGLSQEEQAERIRMLREGDLNVLVATSIAEEGLDIPAVDHVIFYEPIPSGIRYIQRRGRTGRKAPGKVAILVANNTLDMIYLYAGNRRTSKMRKIAENVNSKLQPITRKHHRPPINPLTPVELKKLEEDAQQVKEEPELVQTEAETIRDFTKKVVHTKRDLYMKLLERGVGGTTLEQLGSDTTHGSASPKILKAALGSMMKEGLVTELVQGRYTATSSVKSANRKTYEILVEKIYQGSAVVRVDDKWRARLDRYEYSGPRNIIKKNVRFRAIARLYRLKGTLCISVNEVTEILK
jgi:Fanconi anemia group M protein